MEVLDGFMTGLQEPQIAMFLFFGQSILIAVMMFIEFQKYDKKRFLN